MRRLAAVLRVNAPVRVLEITSAPATGTELIAPKATRSAPVRATVRSVGVLRRGPIWRVRGGMCLVRVIVPLVGVEVGLGASRRPKIPMRR